jgi:hypothetical protein
MGSVRGCWHGEEEDSGLRFRIEEFGIGFRVWVEGSGFTV